ncbi:MAG: hypothetical protein V2I56_14125 [Desulfobacteraceae bacterium]|nr:hypothetical protein [Desulfobacteraceae bacterium]
MGWQGRTGSFSGGSKATWSATSTISKIIKRANQQVNSVNNVAYLLWQGFDQAQLLWMVLGVLSQRHCGKKPLICPLAVVDADVGACCFLQKHVRGSSLPHFSFLLKKQVGDDLEPCFNQPSIYVVQVGDT